MKEEIAKPERWDEIRVEVKEDIEEPEIRDEIRVKVKEEINTDIVGEDFKPNVSGIEVGVLHVQPAAGNLNGSISLAEGLIRYKSKIIAAKESLLKSCVESLEKLEERKKLFQAMIDETNDEFKRIDREMREKIMQIDEEVDKITAAKAGGFPDMENAQRIIRERRPVYSYKKYEGTRLGMCGKLTEEKLRILSHHVISTFNVPGKLISYYDLLS